MGKKRVRWIGPGGALEQAEKVALRFDGMLSLRGLFYQLVPDVLPNTKGYYGQLSHRTAKLRREGLFPALLNDQQWVDRARSWTSPESAYAWLIQHYRRDRAASQPWAVYVGVEKRAQLPNLRSWFADRGLPVFALGGYSSQTFCSKIAAEVREDGRPAALIYAGDFDPSGEDILRDFVQRTGCWDEVRHVALTAEQVLEGDLPESIEPDKVGDGKTTDTRAAGFVERHGVLVQVEVDALSPDALRGYYTGALGEFWDTDALEAEVAAEASDREALRALANGSGK